MKTKHQLWALLTPLLMIMVFSTPSFNQEFPDVIRLKDGREIKAQILFWTNDSLVFEEQYRPGVRIKILRSKLDTIYPRSGPRPEESIAVIKRKYNMYNRRMCTGLAIFGVGAALTVGFGSYALTGGVGEAIGGGGNPGFAATIAGATIGVIGLIITNAGCIGKNKYKKKLEKFSLDFQSDPKITGITLSVKF